MRVSWGSRVRFWVLAGALTVATPLWAQDDKPAASLADVTILLPD